MQPTEDYRRSHLERGDSYDALLANTPFDAYMAEWESRHLAEIVHRLFPTGVPRYLDFACGTGRVTSVVAPLSKASAAVDISPSMIQVAREKLTTTTFHLCDLTKNKLDIGRFDLITSFRFFGNAQDELRDDAMGAIVERLVPGGYLVINSHRNPRALYAILDRLTGGSAGMMDLHLDKLRRLLSAHGLRIVQMRPIGAWMFRSRLLNRYRADDPVAVANERRFGHSALSGIAPDVVVVAQRA